MFNYRVSGLFLMVIASMAACGGGGGSSASSASSPVGTWGNATGTDTYNANNTFVTSFGGCTYTGGTYTLSGNKITVTTVPTAATPSGTAPAASCPLSSTQSALTGYSATFTLSGYTITVTPSAGSVSTSYALAGKWQGAPVSGETTTFTFNGDGTYKLTVAITGGTCDFTGGKYTASGELLTIDTAPTTGVATGSVTCNVANLAALAGSTNWIQLSATTLAATDTNGTTIYTRM